MTVPDFTAALVLRVATDDWLIRQRLDQYERRWQHIHPFLTGDDLRALGLHPGRMYREVLERLRNARLDGEIATRAEEEALVSGVVNGR